MHPIFWWHSFVYHDTRGCASNISLEPNTQVRGLCWLFLGLTVHLVSQLPFLDVSWYLSLSNCHSGLTHPFPTSPLFSGQKAESYSRMFSPTSPSQQDCRNIAGFTRLCWVIAGREFVQSIPTLSLNTAHLPENTCVHRPAQAEVLVSLAHRGTWQV
jgi:hypothetical protein